MGGTIASQGAIFGFAINLKTHTSSLLKFQIQNHKFQIHILVLKKIALKLRGDLFLGLFSGGMKFI